MGARTRCRRDRRASPLPDPLLGMRCAHLDGVNHSTTSGEAVFAAYGWPSNLPDAEILERLLALNLERSADPNVEARSPGTGRAAS